MNSITSFLRVLRKHKGYSIVAGLVLCAGLLGMFLHQGASAPSPDSIGQIPSAATDKPRLAATTEKQTSASSDNDVTPEKDSTVEAENPYFEREVKARLAQVADLYAEQIRYPTFSMPIPGRDALPKYLPNQSFAATMPLDFKDKNSPTISLKTDKRQYFKGEEITAIVSVDGLKEGTWLKVTGRLVENGNTLQQAAGSQVESSSVEGSQINASTPTYQLQFAPGQNATQPSGTELRAVASLELDGRTYEIGTPITYVESVANITHVDVSQVNGEYLEIPVHIDTSNPGYHELGANLYSADTDQPLIHLTAQQEIRSSRGIIPLRAHISALKQQGNSGPYILKDLMLARMPSPPTYTTEYGHTSQESYAVTGHDFDEYDDVPYVDEEAQKRLEFLRQLGSVQ
ncbi:hypothetical protein BTA51_16460 [Hahella sp. CCB-MM4]|uniref:hypothetical protein n=1 Tax=Hahella sp. (strain CCB-MM4) TaxID=1926491 RepID=UPI000B9BD2B7|nr:hypothetical protein [Hahella sp. CCB-MM4]OZG72325.1 hypothetical protein BTA51_16460 [Hahella sp. CCB-MM4]